MNKPIPWLEPGYGGELPITPERQEAYRKTFRERMAKIRGAINQNIDFERQNSLEGRLEEMKKELEKIAEPGFNAYEEDYSLYAARKCAQAILLLMEASLRNERV